MNNTKNDKYYIDKILVDLYFIMRHMKDVSSKDLSENEVLLDSMMFRLIQIQKSTNKRRCSMANKRVWTFVNKGLKNINNPFFVDKTILIWYN